MQNDKHNGVRWAAHNIISRIPNIKLFNLHFQTITIFSKKNSIQQIKPVFYWRKNWRKFGNRPSGEQHKSLYRISISFQYFISIYSQILQSESDRSIVENVTESVKVLTKVCVCIQANFGKNWTLNSFKIVQNYLEIGAPCAIPIPHTVNCTSIVRGHSDVATLNRDLGFDFNVLPHRSTAS